MSMTTSAAIILAAMVAAYAVAKVFKISTELSMLAAALVGGIVGGAGLPGPPHRRRRVHLPRHLPDLHHRDPVHEPPQGIGRRGLRRPPHPHPIPSAQVLCCSSCSPSLLLIPGALTGAGSVTVLIVGGMVATVLGYMGIPKPKAAAIVFIIAGLSAAAPPVSLWAMLTAAGVNMPYVGFFLPLMIPCLLLALADDLHPRLEGQARRPGEALKELPEAPPGMNWLKVALPFLLFFALVVAGRVWPFDFPIMGLPLIFAGAAALTLVLSPRKIAFLGRRAADRPPAPAPHRDADLRRRFSSKS